MSDGHGGAASATVDILIDPVNDCPVARSNSLRINEDQSHFEPAPGLLENDTDVDGDTLDHQPDRWPGPQPRSRYREFGRLLHLYPRPRLQRHDSFRYLLSDGHGCTSSATVDILIDPQPDRPVAHPQTLSTDEDTPLAITLTGSDADGDSLTFATSQPPAHGELSGTPPNVTYKPAPDYFGDDSFAFTASDGSLTSAPAVVSITVNPVNDPPVAREDIAAVDEDGHVAIPVLINDTDVDGDALTVVSVTQPTHGTTAINADGTSIIGPPRTITAWTASLTRSATGTAAPALVR